MRELSRHLNVRPTRSRLGLLVATALAFGLLLSVPAADAKGPVNIKICGEQDCVRKESSRFGAAMLYGGTTHKAPKCSAPVHTAVVEFPGGFDRTERYLIANPRSLIGQQNKNGYVWWRKVRGWKKNLIAKASDRAGSGFQAGPELSDIAPSETRRPSRMPWRVRDGVITCNASM